jgi:hypothetical protein
MIYKGALLAIASATMLAMTPASAEPPEKPMQPKMGMMGQGNGMGMGLGKGKMDGMACKGNMNGKGCHGGQCGMKGGKGGKMGHKSKMGMKHDRTPSLVQGLPHLSMMLKRHWEDPALNLSGEQKEKLLKIREATMPRMMEIRKEVKMLRHAIRMGALSGIASAQIQPKVEKLASLRSEATMTQIKCLEEHKAVLSKDQLVYLMNKGKGLDKMRNYQAKRGCGCNR